MRTWTADEIIDAAKGIIMAPDNTGALGTQPSDILNRINEWYHTELIGDIMARREEFFHVTVRAAMSSTGVHRINPRAYLQKLHQVRLFNSTGEQQVPFNRYAPEDISDLGGTTTGLPVGYYLRGNDIVLYPTSSGSAYIEQVFPFSPSDLVLRENARQVQSVNTTTGVIGLDQVPPSTWTTSLLYDVHSKLSGAEIKAWDKTATALGGQNITLSTIDGSVSGESAVEIGDYVCLSGECAIPGVPKEFHPILAQAGAVAIAEMIKEIDAVQVHKARLEEKVNKALRNIKNRVDGARKLVRGTRFIGMQGYAARFR